MQPVDFSGREVIRFRTRGDGRQYSVMLIISAEPAGPPPTMTFIAPEEWTQVAIRLEDFPTPTPEIIAGLAFVAEGPVGNFVFEVDEVEVRGAWLEDGIGRDPSSDPTSPRMSSQPGRAPRKDLTWPGCRSRMGSCDTMLFEPPSTQPASIGSTTRRYGLLPLNGSRARHPNSTISYPMLY